MTDLNSPGAWPDDAITLTYGEIRQLIALHLDRLGDSLGRISPWEDAHRAAAAMRDGETPLLIREVWSPPEPERPLPGLADGPFDGAEQARASAATDELVRLGGRRPRTALVGEDGPETHRRALATPDHDHTLELVVPAAGIVRCTGDRIDWQGAGD